jgi:outer membrane protein
MRRTLPGLLLCCILFFDASQTMGQASTDTSLGNATLALCLQYAMTHQPAVQQSLIDEDITDKQIRSRLADWYPQIGFNYNVQHTFELPTALVNGVYVRTGATNASTIGLAATQNIFNRDVMFATRTKDDLRKRAKQNTSLTKIDLAVSVSRAFYDVLLSQRLISVLDEAIVRLQRSLTDANNQYRAGIVDKTDYKRATIALNNAKAQHKYSVEQVTAKMAYLKQLMGLSDSSYLRLSYDTTQLKQEAFIDTSLLPKVENRIEFIQLQTQQRLQAANIKYQKSGYIPSVAAFGNYNLGYLSNDLAKIYNNTFPNSNIGVTLAVPIFQGSRRVMQVKQAELEYKRLEWDMISLRNRVNTEYEDALATYKSNLFNYFSLRENVELAEDVYKTLDLQYRSGIRPYLDVITAESDLRSAELNMYVALFQLMGSKLEVQKALGLIQY